ncbi:MAG TPA: crosslink repair DNA glycosylase YcaQ family protein [Jatrophihabitans sp.]|jgi:uncharacterized protein YcaQ|nr:crosslink repair DNA glycosylase YcaQ family protein [Jatrophihabitans sp.]
MQRLSKAEARRIAIRAQLLDARRPTDLLDLVTHLTFLQLDPTAAIAPSADLVAWTRLGSCYRPSQLTDAIERDRTMYEVRAIIRPMADLELHLAAMRVWPFPTEDARHVSAPGRAADRWLKANAAFQQDILELLRTSGPLLSRDIPDTSAVPWQSTGWTGNRNVTQMLEFLSARGEVATVRRNGRQRLWDLAERLYPTVEAVSLTEARRIMAVRRLRSLGIARPEVSGVYGESFVEDVIGETVEVEDTKGTWLVDPEAIGTEFEGRTALLSPFDRLVHDRDRAQDLFDFEYYLEMYKPKEKRRWGYFALPVLQADRLVGKLDATADRKTSVFRVAAIHQDVTFTKAITKAVNAEIEALAGWLGMTTINFA